MGSSREMDKDEELRRGCSASESEAEDARRVMEGDGGVETCRDRPQRRVW